MSTLGNALVGVGVLVFGAHGFVSENGARSQEASIPVPSDPSARYSALDIKKRADGLVEITTRREGSSGRSYARRLIDCTSRTAKYLGEGDTLEQMEASEPGDTMWELCCGSISAFVSVYACEQTRSPVPTQVLR